MVDVGLQRLQRVLSVDPGTQSELDALGSLPEVAGLEGVGRALRGGYLRGIQAPARALGSQLSEELDLAKDLGSGFTRGLSGKPKAPTKVGGPGPAWFAERGLDQTSSAPAPQVDPPLVETTVVPSIRAYKDAQGRTVFSNDAQGQQEAGSKEIDYDLATAALRPAGRQAGGVSSPVARGEDGRPSMIPDPEQAFGRQRELEDLGHAAIKQQLTQQAQTPSQRVQETLGIAEVIGKQLVPDPPDLKEYIQANTAAYLKAHPEANPADVLATITGKVQQRLSQARQQAVEDQFNMLQYPGPTLAGSGALKRGNAADIFGSQ